MWFVTKEKVDKVISDLLTRIESVTERFQKMIEESSKFDALLGPPIELQQCLANSTSSWETLLRAQTHLRFGQVAARDLAKRIPHMTSVVVEYEWLVTEMERARASGRLMVDDHFGKSDAQNR